MSLIEPIPSDLPRVGDQVASEPIRKPGARARSIVVLDPEDDRGYAGAVARVVPVIGSALGHEVLADRATVRDSRVVLSDWRPARRAFRKAIRFQLDARSRPAVFIGDVRSCFPSIQVEAVEGALRRIGSRPTDIERVLDTLRRFAELGITGLPVGPVPSAPLANAVLLGVDEAIHAEGVRHLRWVDDVVAVCDDVPTATRVADAFHRALAREGLRANLSKTMIVADRDQATHHLLKSGSYSATTSSRAMLRAP